MPFWQPQNRVYILKSGPLYWQNDNFVLRGSIYNDLIKIQAKLNTQHDSACFDKETVRGEVVISDLTVGRRLCALCAGRALSLFVKWIRRTWKLSRPSTIHYVWGPWRLLLNSVQVASDGAAKWKCWLVTQSTLSVVIFLHESAAHGLGYILLLAGWNMQYNQVSIVVTEEVYWGNRGLTGDCSNLQAISPA